MACQPSWATMISMDIFVCTLMCIFREHSRARVSCSCTLCLSSQRALRDILMPRGKNWTPHCLAAIFDSRIPSPKLYLKMPPKLPLPHNRGHFFLFQNCPRGEGNCAAIEWKKLSRGNFCLAASRCLSGPSGLSSFVRRRICVTKIHANLVFQACISFWRVSAREF